MTKAHFLLLFFCTLQLLALSAPVLAPASDRVATDVHAQVQPLIGNGTEAQKDLSALIPPPLHANIGPAPKAALLHMQDGVWFFQRLGNLTLSNKRRYAARWRYDMVVSHPQGVEGIQKRVDCAPGRIAPCFEEDKSFDIDHTRAPTFGKIRLARAACASRPDHWLLWSDADALVVNQSIPLESIIDDAYDIMFTYDWLVSAASLTLISCVRADAKRR